MNKAKPTKKHIEWADMELGVIIHYLADIYNPEFLGYKTKEVREAIPTSIINPEKLDTDQWIKAAYDMGAKYAVLVANHCTGFSLWPTKVNDYSIKYTSYKNGNGDVVGEFITSCKKYGLKPGLYYSTGCNGYYDINDNNKFDYKSEYYQEYVKNVEAQVTELWSEYGELFEIWFDGGIIPLEDGGPNLMPILKKYQPNAICFQGPIDYDKNLRWVGNEEGLAPENCWATTNYELRDATGTKLYLEDGVGDPDGDYWFPAETDMGNRTQDSFGGGWAYKANEEDKVYTVGHLMECYCKSVGRNSNLLMGMAINPDGLFEDEQQFVDFGKKIKETFSNPIKTTSGTTDYLEFLNVDKTINYIVIAEDIAWGQNIRDFSIIIDDKEYYNSQCVGHKRIIPLNGINAKSIALKVNKYVEMPIIREFSIY